MLRQDRDFSTIDAIKRQFRGPMEAGKNSVIYMGLVPGPNKADNICGKTKVMGMMQRRSTVYDICNSPHIHSFLVLSVSFSLPHY
jgi:hypothetical protein